jgi:hypothetical protein
MPPYSRPIVDAPPVLDDDGVPYGSRWDAADGPAEDAYSRTSHLERFAPLHAVADALVAHLASTHDVTMVDGPDPSLADPHPDALRTARITPPDGGRGFALEWTAFPGVVVHAPGPRPAHVPASAYPACGCDACDDAWDQVADGLEDEVLTLAGERPAPRPRRTSRPAT